MIENQENKESILLVDDNPTNLQVFFQTLEGAGCSLLIARDGETSFSIARKAIPNLILLDIMMLGIDGFEVCRWLKADRSAEKITVIFCFALNDA